PVTVLGVELDRETSRIASGFRRVASTDDRGEPDGDVGPLPRLGEEFRARVVRDGFIAPFPGGFEISVGDETARVHHSFRNAFSIEMADLFEELIVLQRRGSAWAHRPLILVVVYG